jgi:hypothetical protein
MKVSVFVKNEIIVTFNGNAHLYLAKREEGEAMNIEYQATETPAGRILCFPNNIQHCVTSISNDSEEIGYRKILCFFLINPKITILSSSHVPEQQWERVVKKLRIQLILVTNAIQKKLPKEIILLICDFAKYGFTLQEAKEHRLALMKQRKFIVNRENEEYEEVVEREYSLCEH